jgi:glycosyltransferase involved in cell wall biosynthesis
MEQLWKYSIYPMFIKGQTSSQNARLRKERHDIKLMIVGNGDFRRELKHLVQKLKVPDIEFVRDCKDSEKSYYYKICDLFVLPSIWQPKYCEAWGLVVNEAMQFGKPVITTDAVGSAFDLVKNGINGFVVKNSDADSLYQAIKKIVENPKLAETMGIESKKIIEEGFTYTHMIKGFKDAITFVKTNFRNKRT